MTVPCIISPNISRVATATAAGGIAGSVTNEVGGAAVPGGEVWLFADGETDLGPDSALDIVAVDGSGDYVFSDVDPGNYDVLYNPPGDYSIGSTEPQYQDVSVSAGATTTQDFEAQAAVWFDPMEYDTDSDYTGCGSNSGPNGCFFDNNITGGNAGGHDGNLTVPGGCTITRTLNGPSSSPVMTYTWAADLHPAQGCSDSLANTTLNMAPRFNKFGAFGDEIWFTFYQAESSDFVVGRDTCMGSTREYKYFIADFNTNPYGNVQQLWFELEDVASANPATNTGLRLRIKLTTNSGSTVVAETTNGDFGGDYALGASWVNTFHRWTVGITGVQDAEQVVTVYIDGVPVRTLNGAWLTGRDYQHADALITWQLGANINNGPTTGGMQRWFREMGAYYSRPTLVQGLAE